MFEAARSKAWRTLGWCVWLANDTVGAEAVMREAHEWLGQEVVKFHDGRRTAKPNT